MRQRHPDPVIDEIRAIRPQISAQFGQGSSRLAAYYIELQKQYQDRLLGSPRVPQEEDQPAA
ncbi:MAG TPA: hypothetical protein VF017_12805 [Thermoanaerobaculia bacterium]|nr:hypothetical protein [Thermoanaerobaculia bacterium]